MKKVRLSLALLTLACSGIVYAGVGLNSSEEMNTPPDSDPNDCICELSSWPWTHVGSENAFTRSGNVLLDECNLCDGDEPEIGE